MATARDVANLQGVHRPRPVHVGAAARLVSDEGLGRLAMKIERTQTMAAGVIAHELGLDLYKVDLSGVISRYNLRRNINDAFNRRLQYVIDLPKPREPERERLWRRMLPPQSPRDDGLDFGFLARHFDVG